MDQPARAHVAISKSSMLNHSSRGLQVHGAIYVGGATVFPHQINCAASFNVEAAQQMGRITAKDTKALP